MTISLLPSASPHFQDQLVFPSYAQPLLGCDVWPSSHTLASPAACLRRSSASTHPSTHANLSHHGFWDCFYSDPYCTSASLPTQSTRLFHMTEFVHISLISAMAPFSPQTLSMGAQSFSLADIYPDLHTMPGRPSKQLKNLPSVHALELQLSAPLSQN